MLNPGEHEGVKATVHAGLGLLAATCLLYNCAAWRNRRERHLRRNAWFYGLVVAVEAIQIRRHCR